MALALVSAASPAGGQTPTGGSAAESIRTADLRLVQGRFREAIAEYRLWLKAHPNDASAHNRLGLALQKTRQDKLARQEYRRAIKLEPCYAEAWNNLATLDHVRGRYKQAVVTYRKAVECKPENARLHANLGAAYLDIGELTQSARAYGEAVRLDPAVLDAPTGIEVSVSSGTTAKRYFDLAKVCATRGEPEAALRLLLLARAKGLPDFAKAVAGERAFAEMLSDPRYGELLR